MRKLIILTFVALCSAMAIAETATLRSVPIDQEATPPVTPKVVNGDVKQVRNYPMQPPIIPHRVDGYQTDIYANKCLSCHSRKRTGESMAPMVSVTHYMDRAGNFKADVSPARYFCLQCHVIQEDVPAAVENTFTDMDDLVQQGAE
ncbi:hypothetical protein SIN8267_01599 [Sinobacterium norvegicum]|uniref:Periplasmic nitrate reductase, electron transfer subunit n=1 Tax=Sinobacterium norvegicum TaxID=1641715 RepID=A0ABM9AEL5_9GAMM|nr:nitrate reductase cytochrome c-type subunit [Sinobacterium norvegicum]CAH0991493.1 hypothetical protein SIN8267_01599 [Sinobacterium norvegicum]